MGAGVARSAIQVDALAVAVAGVVRTVGVVVVRTVVVEVVLPVGVVVVRIVVVELPQASPLVL